MFEWLSAKLAGTVIGSILNPVINGLLSAQKQKLDAIGSHEAQVEALAVRATALDQREAEVNAAVVIAEQGNWLTRLPRPVMALSVAFLVAKLLIWDLALGQWTHGHTDKLSPQTFWIMTTIIIAYFGSRAVDTVGSIVKSVFGKK